MLPHEVLSPARRVSDGRLSTGFVGDVAECAVLEFGTSVVRTVVEKEGVDGNAIDGGWTATDRPRHSMAF